MTTTSKEEKLRKLAADVLHSEQHAPLFQKLLPQLNLTEQDVLDAYIAYDLDVMAYGNEIYNSLAMRVVLYLKYLMPGSWHVDRQNAIAELVAQCQGADTLVDIGFGAPSKYLTDYALPRRRPKAILVDLYDSAFVFAQALLELLDPTWQNTVMFRKHDMNKGEPVGSFDVYVFQDSVEHTYDPTAYLTKTVNAAAPHTIFILSLPIGPKTPSHFIDFKTDDDAKQWLNQCGLTVQQRIDVHINPAVDLFADGLESEFYNVVVKCSKA